MRVNKPLHVWMVTPEMSRVKKSGGLADAVYGLSDGLIRLGHRVTAIMPKYPGTLEFFLREKFRIEFFEDLVTPIGDYPTPTSVFRGSLPDDTNDTKLNTFFLDTNDLSAFGKRDKLYGDHDDALRFFFFNRSTHELYCKLLADNRRRHLPDVVHCHDWQSGFTPFLFRYFGPQAHTRTVYSIHNLGYSCGERNMSLGEFSFKISVPEWRDPPLFSARGVEFYGRVEPHKAAILYADKVVTVSSSYAEELLSGRVDAPANLYAGLLQQRRDDFHGIINGLPDNFNPEYFHGRGFLRANFSADTIEGRWQNREALQEKFGLLRDPQAMIVVWSSRLADQKGIDITLQAIPDMLKLMPKLQFIFIGDGEQRYIDDLTKLAAKFPGRVKSVKFEEPLEILALGGGDVLLMPSRYEPCGLNQMKAQLLGCIPLVRETGGLKDTVKFGQTGFSFWELSPETLTKSLVETWIAFQNKEQWRAMVSRVMRLDYSWTTQAQKYVDQLYLPALDRAA